jgi:hypothetical protein
MIMENLNYAELILHVCFTRFKTETQSQCLF